MVKQIKAEETYPIRLEVLRNNIDLSFKFDGDFNTDSFHLGAFKKGELIGIASFMRRKTNLLDDIDNQYQLRGMATLQKVRGEKYGEKILNEAFSILKEKNVKILWCNAREVALGFYQKNGFKIIGKPFNIEQIGKHYVLVKSLK